MNKDINIIDNFLEQDIFLELSNTLFSNNFPWYFYDYKSSYDDGFENDPHFQFVHIFYSDENGGTISSNFFEYILPLIKKINPTSLVRVKANLTTRTVKNEIYGFHKDIGGSQNFIKTGIFYLNDSNGGTVFENDYTVNCIKNRFVFFPSQISHSGISATDTKSRIVINFNYI
jgi:hypothetical protein